MYLWSYFIQFLLRLKGGSYNQVRGILNGRLLSTPGDLRILFLALVLGLTSARIAPLRMVLPYVDLLYDSKLASISLH